ncbi:hypothetical protein TPB0596_12350 [Tsukamurella pulmonis]|nr:hypothetical protein TPB0596_12350 [Tsukamurella pulmonis]
MGRGRHPTRPPHRRRAARTAGETMNGATLAAYLGVVVLIYIAHQARWI